VFSIDPLYGAIGSCYGNNRGSNIEKKNIHKYIYFLKRLQIVYYNKIGVYKIISYIKVVKKLLIMNLYIPSP